MNGHGNSAGHSRAPSDSGTLSSSSKADTRPPRYHQRQLPFASGAATVRSVRSAVARSLMSMMPPPMPPPHQGPPGRGHMMSMMPPPMLPPHQGPPGRQLMMSHGPMPPHLPPLMSLPMPVPVPVIHGDKYMKYSLRKLKKEKKK
ncbi:hypothetical protein HDE_07502 [Halotydeus destructor]|nr:hypothetical protein HDE_07502 [Halotydeus destructor]